MNSPVGTRIQFERYTIRVRVNPKIISSKCSRVLNNNNNITVEINKYKTFIGRINLDPQPLCYNSTHYYSIARKRQSVLTAPSYV